MERNTLSGILNHLSNQLAGSFNPNEIQTIKKYIVEAVLNVPYHQVFLNTHQKVNSEKVSEVEQIIAELLAGKPLQYAVGLAYFSDLALRVTLSVLIPRPETEELVSLIVKENKVNSPTILDVGTGSGCIALALAKHIADAKVTGVDISNDALSVAKENAAINKLSVNFLQVDILQPAALDGYTFDIVVSNPPYVRDSEMKFMNRNVLDYEPYIALFVPDSDPLRFFRAIALLSIRCLSPYGWLWFEINEALGSDIVKLLKSFGFGNVLLINDFRGKPRFVKAQKSKP
ncbi:MAG TPA: peptide chain release factor N(5)-glutamine methyltransferase [Bacteroidales bacterium]|nr:peptide chain release factor N(5)-glutamine methyltransferase [Bacteroidales bacterium]